MDLPGSKKSQGSVMNSWRSHLQNMIHKQSRVDTRSNDTKQRRIDDIKQKLYCLVNLTEHKEEKEKWHFCLLRGWASLTNVSLANNSHFKISNIYLIKINWTKQEQVE